MLKNSITVAIIASTIGIASNASAINLTSFYTSNSTNLQTKQLIAIPNCEVENPPPICNNDPPIPSPLPKPPVPVPGSLHVTIQLTNFTCHDADEERFYSNGDEPYLFVAAIYADGTTIKISDLGNAKVRIKSPTKTHGNLGRKGVDDGDSFSIPTSIGRFQTNILPIDGLPQSIGKEKSLVGLIVIAMEEDTTKTSAANAAQRALVKVLQKELDEAVRAVSEPNVEVLKGKIKSAMRNAIKKESWGSISGIFSFLDSDDYINADLATWSYKQLEDAGNNGIPINMEFKASGVRYSIKGNVKAR
ncbi:MAG: hypothetical protein WBA07_07865 [Rivularia sp. (in: cyanobacteria)]